MTVRQSSTLHKVPTPSDQSSRQKTKNQRRWLRLAVSVHPPARIVFHSRKDPSSEIIFFVITLHRLSVHRLKFQMRIFESN